MIYIWLPTLCVGLGVFAAAWLIGDWLTSLPSKWRPSGPGPGIQHGEYSPFLPPPVYDFGEYPTIAEDRCRDLSCTCNQDRRDEETTR